MAELLDDPKRKPAATPDDAEFEAWKAARRAPAVQTPDDAEFEAWKRTRGSTGDVDLREPAAGPPAPTRLRPVGVSRVEDPPAPRAPVRIRRLPQPLAAADAAYRGPARANPQAIRLTGKAKVASDLFQAAADNPVSTATAIPLAPIRSAATAGTFIGQRINDATDPDANDVAAAMGVDRVTDREAAIAAAQLAALGLGGAVNRGVTNAAVRIGAGRLSPTIGAAAEGAGVGAAYDPEHPARGAAIGGALGAAAEAIPRIRWRRPEPVAEADPARLLASPDRVRASATARVVEEPAAASPAEPDFTVEPLPAAEGGGAAEVPDLAEFEAWKRSQGAPPPSPTPSAIPGSLDRPFAPDWDPAAGEPRSLVRARERELIDAPTEGATPASLTNRLEVLDRLATEDPEHGARAAAAATRIRAQLVGEAPAIPKPPAPPVPDDVVVSQERWDSFDPKARSDSAPAAPAPAPASADVAAPTPPAQGEEPPPPPVVAEPPIPGRRQDYTKLHPADLVELLAAEQRVLEAAGTKANEGNFARYNESLGYPVAGSTLSGAIGRQHAQHATKRIEAIEAQLRAHGVDQKTIDAVRVDPDHATERAAMMREAAGDYGRSVWSGDEITDDAGKVLFARAAEGESGKAKGPRVAEPKPTSEEPGAPPSADAEATSVTAAAAPVNRHVDAVRRIFAPASRTPEAGTMGRVVREHAAQNAQKLEHAREAMKGFSKSFDRMAPADRLAFIDRLETGQSQPTPELTAAATSIRKFLDETRDEIQALGTGKLEKWIEHYFPHIWKDPTGATPVIGRLLGKRPLEGPKSFLKKRSIPTTAEGIAAGLEPITDNPVDLTLLKLREMRRYLAAHRILQEAQGQGIVQYVHATAQPPAGYQRIQDGIGTVYGKPTVEASEAYDKQVRDGLEAAIARLQGLTHQRKPRTGLRGALGYAKGGEEIVSKFGTHDGVIMHELGHILDARYQLGSVLRQGDGADQELHDLAALRHETSPDVKFSFREYVQKSEERTANALHAFIHAPEKMAAVAPGVKARLEAFLASKPELKGILDIKPSLELKTGKTELPVGGLVVRGHYYAPEAVATVLNNYLSPGLRGNALYDAYQGVNNTLNQAQLGLSAFHVGFTSMDAAVSQVAVGLQNLSHGRIRKGLGQVASYPIAPISTFYRGSRVLQAYLHPDGKSSELLAMVDAVVAAGGRARQDSFYATGAPKKFMEALRHARALEAGRHAIPALFELAAKPIMEGIVPRQKLGVFAQLAERAMADLPPDASRDDVRKALGRAWDSVDNRLGQLVYDNLFWDKALKDLAMASVRSVGWNLGTIRELGGGAADLGRAGVRAAKGERPELTERASYFIALPIAVGLAGAITGYLLTGERPEELRDYFFPKTGRKNVEGNDERVQLPSYMKDVVAYAKHPVQTVEHKAAPAISLLSDMLHNETYYGDQIRNPDDPAVQQLQQEARFLAGELLPFGVRNAQEAGKRVVDPRMKVAGFVGVTAAPRDATRSPAQNKMMEYLAGKSMRGGTPEEAAAREQRGDLLQAARQGTVNDRDLDAAEDAGRLTTRQRIRVQRAADGESDVWVDRFKRLEPDQALAVYKLSTPKERERYRDALEAKLIKAGREEELDGLDPITVGSTGPRIRIPK